MLATGDSFNNGLGTGGTGGFFGLFIAPGGSIVDITKTLDEVLKLDFEMVVGRHNLLDMSGATAIEFARLDRFVLGLFLQMASWLEAQAGAARLEAGRAALPVQ